MELEGFDRSFKSFHCHQPLILSLNPLCACNTITRSGAYLTHVMTILWRKSLSSQREMIAVIMSPYRFCWNSSDDRHRSGDKIRLKSQENPSRRGCKFCERRNFSLRYLRNLAKVATQNSRRICILY